MSLSASGLGFWRGTRPLFSGIDFALAPGALLQVTGANGSGKSTLLRVLGTLLPPAAGQLLWQGRPVRAGDAAYLQAIAYVGHANGIAPELSPAAHLRLAASLAGTPASREAVHAALDSVGMASAADAPARTLSQGQRRRVALSRLQLVPRPLWLLDEPLAALDADGEACFDALLAGHLQAGGMAVMATHQPLPRASATLRLG